MANVNTGNITMNINLFSENDNDNTDCPFDYFKTIYPQYNILFKITDTGTGITKYKIDAINKTLNLNKNKTSANNINNPAKFDGFGLQISQQSQGLVW